VFSAVLIVEHIYPAVNMFVHSYNSREKVQETVVGEVNFWRKKIHKN